MVGFILLIWGCLGGLGDESDLGEVCNLDLDLDLGFKVSSPGADDASHRDLALRVRDESRGSFGLACQEVGFLGGDAKGVYICFFSVLSHATVLVSPPGAASARNSLFWPRNVPCESCYVPAAAVF